MTDELVKRLRAAEESRKASGQFGDDNAFGLAADRIEALGAEVARLREGIRTSASDLATEHFRDPEDTRLCRGCRGMWPCVSSGVAGDLRALLAGEETDG